MPLRYDDGARFERCCCYARGALLRCRLLRLIACLAYREPSHAANFHCFATLPLMTLADA